MQEDLRIVELKKREGFAMDAQTGVLAVVVVGILLSIGLYVNSKVGDSIGIPATWSSNTTVCPSCTTWSQAEVNTNNAIQGNILDALDIQSVGLIILGVSVLVGFLYLMLR